MGIEADVKHLIQAEEAKKGKMKRVQWENAIEIGLYRTKQTRTTSRDKREKQNPNDER